MTNILAETGLAKPEMPPLPSERSIDEFYPEQPVLFLADGKLL